jgi:hypothetical protein
VSVVTNLMLSVPVNSLEYKAGALGTLLTGAGKHIRDWCEAVNVPEDERGTCRVIRFPEKTVDAVSAGTKHMEVDVYAWGANYLDLEGFLEAVRTAPWHRGWSTLRRVQVFVMGQDDDFFSVYMLNEHQEWERWTPPERGR